MSNLEKKNIYVNTARRTEDETVEVSYSCSHCFRLRASRTDYKQQCTVRDVGLTVGYPEFIHVISLSPLTAIHS